MSSAEHGCSEEILTIAAMTSIQVCLHYAEDVNVTERDLSLSSSRVRALTALSPKLSSENLLLKKATI